MNWRGLGGLGGNTAGISRAATKTCLNAVDYEVRCAHTPWPSARELPHFPAFFPRLSPWARDSEPFFSFSVMYCAVFRLSCSCAISKRMTRVTPTFVTMTMGRIRGHFPLCAIGRPALTNLMSSINIAWYLFLLSQS